ncbi:MAG TPA: FAD-linked oxidase C-terminal domain-containing protein [Fimbriiglobus sp.]|nr:FAD-linked oxidase C-terminal domain-containing protein [Fimbriiglobus sp.]
MAISLTVLRKENEEARFERLKHDDGRTAIPPEAARELEADLRRSTTAEVRFDPGSRALYSTDGSNYRQVPIGVVVPRTIDDVVATVAAARAHSAPVLSRGGGTSLAGQCCNVAVVMDFSKYLHRILHIDPDQKLGTVQPGCILDTLRHTAAREAKLMFAPDPATHTHCTLGGMLGNDSCGSHSLLGAKFGRGLRVADNTRELEVLTYDGTRMRVGETTPDELERIIRAGGRRGEIYAQMKALRDRYADDIRTGFPKLGRRVSGYNLDALLPEDNFHVAKALVGTESTCVTILEATLNLVPNPAARSLLVLGYPDIYSACEHLLPILEFKPTALEGLDHLLFEYVRKKGDQTANLDLLPAGRGFLMVEFGGDSKSDSDDQAKRCMAMLKKAKNPPAMKLYTDPHKEEMLWKVREGGLGSTAWVPGVADGWPGWEDSAVPVPKVADYLRDLRKLFDKYGYKPSLYGHFGQGCIHCRIQFDLYTAEGVKNYRSFMDEATTLVVGYGGSLSGEHGDGQARGEYLPKMFGDRLYQAFREFKAIWDPDGKMNPGKKIDAYPIDANLRLGPDYNPPQPPTHFAFPHDRNSFARAALRCVGVGECRREGGQTMCPSYMVTREEKHSTRGRAHLLFEMMNGEVLTGGWREEAVKDALDLCLACKGCKHDCPVNVDMATYKAEFLSHYHAGHARPRHAYSMGLIDVWAGLASLAPGLVNLVGRTPGLGAAAKWLGGITQQRQLPAFAAETFKSWFFRRRPRNSDGPPVVLWADTFTNHFLPGRGRAAVEVLEDAGFRVYVPRAHLCCGRPLYDFGMLDTAKRYLRDILTDMRPVIEAGVPVVGLEPSCTAVFRDELVGLFPTDEDAKRLHDQSFLLSEFLNHHADGWAPPHVGGRALVHVHCHHKSVLGRDDEEELLQKMGIDVREPEPGCCGLAGSFGFEAGKYDVSMAIGERNLLPAVRAADPDTLLIADGFSCETQILQGAGRTALHLAEVIRRGLGPLPDGESGLARGRRESAAVPAALAVGAALLGGGLLAWALTRRRTEGARPPAVGANWAGV